jgi:hypothetical protein
MNQSTIIESIFRVCNYKSYLELGLYDGTTIDRIIPHSVYHMGVDIKDVRFNKTSNFFLGTTDEFFNQCTTTFDMIFIDADHSYEAALSDFNKALLLLNEYGTILLHDTDPRESKLFDSGYCGNSYLMNSFLINNSNIYTHTTLPINECGITIVRKINDLRHIKEL